MGLNRFLGSSSVVICVDADASARNASRSSPKSSSVSSMQIISLQGDDLLSPVQFWSNRAIFFTAPIERPYSREPQAVGAVYDRPGFFVQSREEGNSPRRLISAWPDRHPEILCCSLQLRSSVRKSPRISRRTTLSIQNRCLRHR